MKKPKEARNGKKRKKPKNCKKVSKSAVKNVKMK